MIRKYSYRHWLLGFILACVLPAGAWGQMIRVRISPAENISRISYQCLGDEAVILTQDSFPREIVRLKTLDIVRLDAEGGKVRLRKGDRDYGLFSGVLFWANDGAPRFGLLLDKPSPPKLHYFDHLAVRTAGSQLLLDNVMYLEDYVQGVVSAEAGGYKNLDFFKVQAVSARTYALNNLGRHSREGYDLCDQTHCQAYKGIPVNNPLIQKAVEESREEVIVWADTVLIDAVFSANCGGFTANSEDVWINRVDYLRAIPDYNFCEGSKSHDWHLMVPKQEFLDKLGDYFKIEPRSFEVIPDVSGRVRRIVLNDDPKLVISGEEVRRLFRLRSARFHVYDGLTMLMLEGTGFGHGVGMCQDGAYHMGELGMDYRHIIKHYYQDVEIRKVTDVPRVF